MPTAPRTPPSWPRRHVLLWFVPFLSWSLIVLTPYALFTGLHALDPFLVPPQEFPLNALAALILIALIIVLSVGAGVILNQGMCHWLLDEGGSGWDSIGTALRQWTSVTILLLVLVFWSRASFPAAPIGGIALTALGGGIGGAWLSQYAHDVPAAYHVGWRRAMILTWGGGWAGIMFLLYRLLEVPPPIQVLP